MSCFYVQTKKFETNVTSEYFWLFSYRRPTPGHNYRGNTLSFKIQVALNIS